MSWRDSYILTCKGSKEGILDSISSYLAGLNYSISNSNTTKAGDTYQLKAEAKRRPFGDLIRKPVPKIFDITVEQRELEAHVRLKIVQFPELRLYVHGITLSVIAVAAFAFAMGKQRAEAHDSYAAIWFAWVFSASMLLVISMFRRTFSFLNPGIFLDAIRSAIERQTGNATFKVSGMPGMVDAIMPLILLMASLGLIAWDPDSWVLLGLLPLFALVGIIYFAGGRSVRFFVNVFGLEVGWLFGIYATMPFWGQLMLGTLIKEQMGWQLRQDPLLSFAIRQSLPLSWHPHGYTIPSSLVTPAIIIIPLIMAVAVASQVASTFGITGQSVQKLIKTVDRLRSQLRRASDNVAGKYRSFSFMLTLAIGIIWVPINVYGAYLGLSSCEVAILGRNALFRSSSIDASRETLAVFIAYMTHSDPASIPVSMFSRIILFMFAAPVVVLIGLIVRKTVRDIWREAQDFKDTRCHKQDVPIEVMTTVGEIADWAGIARPLVRVSHYRGIGASSMIPIVPGREVIVTVTADSIQQLSRAELNGLLSHEIGHTKQRRSYYYKSLHFLSQWTFMGNGWLLSGYDWFAAEYESDSFALAWCRHKDGQQGGQDALLGLFKKLQQQEIMMALSSLGNSQVGTLLAREVSWLPPWLAHKIAEYPTLNMLKKMRAAVEIYYHLYLGDAILAYCHPELRQRIERLKKQ